MTQPNFATMTTKELTAYVLRYRSDDEAFYALADRVHAEGVEVKSMEHLTELIEQKQRSREKQSE